MGGNETSSESGLIVIPADVVLVRSKGYFLVGLTYSVAYVVSGRGAT